MNIINIEDAINRKNEDNYTNAVAAVCCFYSLRDITQEINEVLKLAACMTAPLQDAILDHVSAEDAECLANFLQNHGNNLVNLSRAIMKSAHKKGRTTNREELSKVRREWKKYGDGYCETRRPIVDNYLEYIIPNSNNIE